MGIAVSQETSSNSHLPLPEWNLTSINMPPITDDEVIAQEEVTEETTPETETKGVNGRNERRGQRIKNQYAYNSKQPNLKSRGVCILCETTKLFLRPLHRRLAVKNYNQLQKEKMEKA